MVRAPSTRAPSSSGTDADADHAFGADPLDVARPRVAQGVDRGQRSRVATTPADEPLADGHALDIVR